MLSPDELGAFILVLANSMQDADSQHNLAADLQRIFHVLRERQKSGELQAAADDLAVFLSLSETGIEGFSAWRQRWSDHWQCAYNPLRALRPARSSGQRFFGLEMPFNEQGFHFDKAFLRPEILSEETFRGQSLRILYHKFPFVAYHLLILPGAEQHRPQWLDYATHALTWALVEQVASPIPGFGAAFNSLGAGASVNHLHLHGFVQEELFAIERPDWRHNGGGQSYPVDSYRFTSAEESWAMIESLHADNQPYNLLYRPGVCYVIPRAPQGERQLPGWMQTAVWHELCGAFNLSDQQAFETLTADQIVAGLRCLHV